MLAVCVGNCARTTSAILRRSKWRLRRDSNGKAAQSQNWTASSAYGAPCKGDLGYPNASTIPVDIIEAPSTKTDSVNT
jgi:hypothetical protein